MSAFTLSGITFAVTLGGIWLGTLLRRTLPRHVLGLLIGAAKGSFDTQSTQVKQITANIILLDNILAQRRRNGNTERLHRLQVDGELEPPG